MSTIPSVDLGMAAFSGIASANISIAAPVLSQNLCYVAIPDSRTGAACVRRSAVGTLTPTFPTRSELSLVAICKHMFYTCKKELVRGGYMKVRRDDIASSVVRLIIEAGRSPYLFVGSGFFRRHMGTVD